MQFPLDFEMLELALLVAGAVVLAVGIPVVAALLRRHAAGGGASNAPAEDIASQALAWSDAFRGASSRKHPAWDGHSIELAPPQEHF